MRTLMSGLYFLVASTKSEKVKAGHHCHISKKIQDLFMFQSFLDEFNAKSHGNIYHF